MTHSLGKNTVNFPLNLTTEERLILGRFAFRRDMTMAECLRQMIRRGVALSEPKTAIQLAESRRQRMAAALLVLFLAWLAFDHSEDAIRRARRGTRSVRVTREVREGTNEEAIS